MSLIRELECRNDCRLAGLYRVAGWPITQVTGRLPPMSEAPAWLARPAAIILDPVRDPLRKDAPFGKLLARGEPATTLQP